jgi:capsular polysaccharide export protein
MKDVAERRRTFLFLQGNASPFFARLGRVLQAHGHFVRRINFNGGDVFFWPSPDAVDYAGAIEGWPAFLSGRLAEWGVTDVVLMADCRPLHYHAIRVARALQLSVYVFEEGYLRPNWITLERGGVNAFSSLGRDPDWFIEAARALPEWREPEPAVNSMVRRAVDDIAYVLATLLGSWRFPGYRSHRPWSSWVEYVSGGRRFVRRPLAKHRLTKLLDAFEQSGKPYFLFPLQIESDSQIQYHSPFSGLHPAIEQVIRSFAAFAPADSELIVTEHPLDTCPNDWRKTVAGFAAEHGVSGRVHFFEGGSPNRAILGCRGVVTVNSTLGYLALTLGKPLIALGTAIYGIPELTFQNGIDRFWADGATPNAAVFDAFRRVVAARTQVNGSFYGRTGLTLAVKGAAARIEADLRPAPAFAAQESQPARVVDSLGLSLPPLQAAARA